MTQTQQTLLYLIRLALWNEKPVVIKVDDWQDLFESAELQGVAGVVLDGINCCYEKGIAPGLDFETKMEWIGLVTQMEERYQQQEKIIRGLASFYHKHSIEMMV